MRLLKMADVGDGLCWIVTTESGHTMQIDWGSQQGGKDAYCAWLNMWLGLSPAYISSLPTSFALSHFHTDHYNALLWAASNSGVPTGFGNLRQVYSPCLPKIYRRKEFYDALFAMNGYVFGNQTGSMDFDFLSALSRLSGRRFDYVQLSQGDNFEVDGTKFKCLWPPKEIEEGNLSKRTERALTTFNQALEEDPILRKIHESIRNDQDWWSLMNPEDQSIAYSPDIQSRIHRSPIKHEKNADQLPAIVKKANELLRGVANDLSLVFRQEEFLLSLGDLENRTLPHIVDQLQKDRVCSFDVIIAPHHGTHWHDCLFALKAKHTFCSIGPKLIRGFKKQFLCISHKVHRTFDSGNVTQLFHS